MGSGDAAAERDALRARVTQLERAVSCYRGILEAVPAIVLRVTPAGSIEYINRILPEYAADPPVGRSVYSIAPPEQHEVMRTALMRAAETRTPASFEAVGVAPDGTRDWYVTHVGPILEGDKLTGLALVSTNSSLARQALLESQARLQLALDAGNVGVWSWDVVADLLECDDKLTAMFGLTRETSPTTMAQFLQLVPPGKRSELPTHLERALETGVFPDFDLEISTANGSRWFILKGGVLHSATGEAHRMLGGVVEVTERRRVNEHLRQAQKLEAVGQLSAGIAHNFNNMLAVILPALDLARREASPQCETFLIDAMTATTNASNLVRRLMVFSREPAPECTSYEPLADVIRRVGALCQQTFDRSVALTLRELDAASHAMVQSGAMEQVLMNLLINARDALESAPPTMARIEVAARLVPAEEIAARHTAARGDYVELRVVDNGCGMDELTQRCMLEPFFSTKGPGRGTGLGLSTAWATVRAHRGHLECESIVGVGTTFRMFLPAQEPPVACAPNVPRSPALTDVGHGRLVLIIDDEPSVRRASAAMLTAAGFAVVTAASGDDGVAVAQTSELDAVLLDYSMPGLSPQATLAALRTRDPALPVVLLSGLGFVNLEGVTERLTKPVAQDELVAALQRALSVR